MSRHQSPSLVRAEMRVTGALASIFALRMFGLFMLLPVLSLLGTELPDASPLLIGTAVGAYGLMQALLQIPFGALSDRFGRRPLLVLGLLLFVAGGAVAALSETIHGVIIGRAIQGSGAIASVIMALVSDVVSEAHRTRAMAGIGMSVGGSFVLALILGPVLASWTGLSGLFWITSGLGLLALVIAVTLVPAVRASSHKAPLSRRQRMARVLGNPVLMRLNVGILVLHAVMTCSFVVVPLWLHERLGFDMAQHSLLYLAVLVAGFLAMVPLIIRSERRGFLGVKRLAIGLLLVAELLLAFFAQHIWQFVLALFVFFTAFNLLEALLPSLVGRAAPAGTKGTSMGVYSTAQFLGVFLGGQLGGLALQYGDGSWAFIGGAVLVLGWLLALIGMPALPRMDNRVLALAGREHDSIWLERLHNVEGVIEAVLVPEEGIALLKVDPARLDEVALEKWASDDAQAVQT
ncbi:MAG: MFS transporter [Alcanivoracaceae bacterium]|jgi:predicted MFS family arabinose efflux permease|nr:MFS transporter [Alcanivoracaceae bacterium]